MAVFSVARPERRGRRHHQARRDRARRADPRRQQPDAVPRRTRSAVPGDPGHVDVEPARRRHRRAARRRASRLDAGDGPVGAHDDRHRQDVDKEDGTTPGRPVRLRWRPHRAAAGERPRASCTTPGFDDYLAFLCGTGDLNPTGGDVHGRVGSIDPSDLNLATIGIGELAGVQTVTRTVTNVGPAGDVHRRPSTPRRASTVAVDPPIARPSPPARPPTYTVTFTSDDGATFDEWTFGSLTWSDGAATTSAARSPSGRSRSPRPTRSAVTGTAGTASYDVTFGYNGDFDDPGHGLVAGDGRRPAPSSTTRPTTSTSPSRPGSASTSTRSPSRPGRGTCGPRCSTRGRRRRDDLDLYLFRPATIPSTAAIRRRQRRRHGRGADRRRRPRRWATGRSSSTAGRPTAPTPSTTCSPGSSATPTPATSRRSPSTPTAVVGETATITLDLESGL